MKTLLVEDSKVLRQSLTKALKKSGYAVESAMDGEEGQWKAENQPFDVIVLDIMLPKRSGLEVLKSLRATGLRTPILMLTARDSISDRVEGLELGADDYLTKPFALEEFLARIRALCRRGYNVSQSTLELHGLSISSKRREAAYAGQTLRLKPREFAILEYMAMRVGTVLSRTIIEEHIYQEEEHLFSNVVDSAVCIIRRELTRAGAPPLIHTRRGEGYIFEHRHEKSQFPPSTP